MSKLALQQQAESHALPSVRSAVALSEVVERLDAEARRGRLAGWMATETGEHGRRGSHGEPVEIGRLSDFGVPFESVLLVWARAANAGEPADGSVLRFERRIKPRVPLLVAVALVATVWPGITLTDSLLRTYWAGYDFATWMWYLPMTVPFVPLTMWTAWKRSNASGDLSARELIARIAEILDGVASESAAGTDART